MSIAWSVSIAPSRRLRLLQQAYGAACVIAAAFILIPLPSTLLSIAQSSGWTGAPLRWPLPVATLCLLAGLALLLAACRPSTVHTLDLLGPGPLALTVQQGGAAASRRRVALLAHSTLWPHLLVLRLAVEDGRTVTLLILPDCVAPGQFRPLCMALRARAARSHEKIL